MTKVLDTPSVKVLVRGGGDLASGVAWRLHVCGFRVCITEIAQPMAVRRAVSFCEAVYDGQAEVEGVKALRLHDAHEVSRVWEQGCIPVFVDPEAETRHVIRPYVLVDAVLAKTNLGTTLNHAPVVIALGPGFTAGEDAHFIVETNRGHCLGRLLSRGSAQPNTGVPGSVLGITSDRVLRAPASGRWESRKEIGDPVNQGDIVGAVEGQPVRSKIDGIVRGLIRPGIAVSQELKIGDVDPRGDKKSCYTISEKALAIAGGVLEGVLRSTHR
jgi:xanthine dehydrogenase accessory factor